MMVLALVQEIGVAVIGFGTLGWLLLRVRSRGATGNCCGERECPAAKQIVRDLEEARR